MVSEQCRFFLVAVLYGFGACLGYDLLRTLRRIVPHSLFFIHGEDLVFWTAAVSVFYYGVLNLTGGVLRAYYFIGIALAFIIYEWALSPFLLKITLIPAKMLSRIFSKLQKECKRTEKKIGKSKKSIDG